MKFTKSKVIRNSVTGVLAVGLLAASFMFANQSVNRIEERSRLEGCKEAILQSVLNKYGNLIFILDPDISDSINTDCVNLLQQYDSSQVKK